MPSIISATTTSGLVNTADNSGDLQFQTQNGANTITLPNSSGTLATTANLSGFGFKNRIINGAMVIAQRGTSSLSVDSATSYYPVDRFGFYGSVASSKFTAQQSSTAPAGFSKSLLLTSSSAYSVAAGDFFYGMQGIEGYNVADLNWGTANAKTITLSFWVRSSVTGNFGAVLRNLVAGADRGYPFLYNIAAANTWEQKSITIAGDTSGTWLTDNGCGMAICFSVGSGSNWNGTPNAWATGNFIGATGQVNLVATNGATFYITGVQLEVGSTATSFDYRPYGTELALCQRYFQSYGFGVNGTTGDSCIGSGMFYTASELLITAQFLVIMRAVPTYSCATVTNGFRYHRAGAATSFDTVPYFGSTSTSAAIIGSLSVPVSGTAGYATQVYAQASGAKINFSAEL